MGICHGPQDDPDDNEICPSCPRSPAERRRAPGEERQRGGVSSEAKCHQNCHRIWRSPVSCSCESGGLGRRTRLRIWRGNPWGFESPLSHQKTRKIVINPIKSSPTNTCKVL